MFKHLIAVLCIAVLTLAAMQVTNSAATRMEIIASILISPLTGIGPSPPVLYRPSRCGTSQTPMCR